MESHRLTSLIKMVNQIAENNMYVGDEAEAAQIVATHLRKFWARSMKQQIIEYHQQDGSKFLPVADQAVELIIGP